MAASSKKGKLDRLAAELEADAQGPGSGGAVDQSDIDALLAEFQNAAAQADPPLEAVDKASADAGGSGPIGQGEIDRLLAGAAGPAAVETAAGAGDEAGDDALAGSAENLSDQEKMDRLIAELQAESRQQQEPAAAVDTAAPLPPEPDLGTDPSTGKGPRSDPGPAPVEDFSPLDDAEMALDGYEDAEAAKAEALPPGPPEPQPPKESVEGQSQVEPAPEAPSPAGLESRLAQRHARRRAVVLDEKKTARRWPRWMSTGVLLAAAAISGALGYHVYEDRQRAADTPSGAPTAAATASAEADPTAAAGSARLSSDAPDGGPAPQDALEDRFARIDAARQAMLEKQSEILNLRREYEEGIQEMESVVVRQAQAHGITRFADAVAVEAIDYGLQTIQRRLGYIKRLDAPIQRLYDGSEAMLFARRLASVNLLLVGLAEGIDSSLIGQEMDAALAEHRLAEGLQLAAPTDTASGISLETIWQRIVARIERAGKGGAPVAAAPAAAPVAGDDTRIWNALCRGDYGDKYQITTLSVAAAGCLADWKGSELFLNRLSQLNAPEAAALSRWKGQWMAMNRIDTLSEDATKAIFQWPGTRLSLNGLRHLPDGAAQAVAAWPGKELELMGLERLTLPVAKAIAHWKQAGGRLFVPEKFYRKQ